MEDFSAWSFIWLGTPMGVSLLSRFSYKWFEIVSYCLNYKGVQRWRTGKI